MLYGIRDAKTKKFKSSTYSGAEVIHAFATRGSAQLVLDQMVHGQARLLEIVEFAEVSPDAKFPGEPQKVDRDWPDYNPAY
jgi:hypothetical protein